MKCGVPAPGWGVVTTQHRFLPRLAKDWGLKALSPWATGDMMSLKTEINNHKERSMSSRAKTTIALAGGALAIGLAAGVGGGVLLSDTTGPTPIATPTSSVAPAPAPSTTAGAPSTDGNAPNPPGGCIPHANC